MSWRTEDGCRGSGGQFEQLVDELILTPNIRPAHPSNLSLSHHVDRFITLNRSSRRLELSESLLGVHSSFDRSMVLFDDVVQILHGPVPTATAERPFLLNSRDRRGVDGGQIRVDDARLWMRSITQSLAKQPFGGIGIAEGRQQEIDRSACRIDSPDTDNTSGLCWNCTLFRLDS